MVVTGIAIALAALISIAYFGTLHSQPLLDEIYLIALMKARSTSVMDFLTAMIDWNGPLQGDTWGFMASGILGATAGAPLSALRAFSILVHALNAFLVFLVVKNSLASPDDERSYVSTWLAGCAAAIFAIYPLTPETVSWLGGLAYEIGSAFWILAFYLYIKGKRERNWTTLGVSWISFLLSVLCDSSLWSSGFIMVVLELAKSFIGPPPPGRGAPVPTEDEVFEDAVDKMLETESRHMHEREQSAASNTTGGESQAPDTPPSTNDAGSEQAPDTKPATVYDESDNPDDLFDTLTPALPFIVLGVVISIRTLPATGNEQLPADMIAGINDWGRVFKNLFVPAVGEQYLTIFAAIYAIPLVVSAIALAKSKTFRQNSAFLLAWLIMIVVPHLHTALMDETLIGSRFAYSALVPVAGIIALAFFSPVYAFRDGEPKLGRDKLLMLFSAVMTALLLSVNGICTMKQNSFYSERAIVLEELRQSARAVMTEAGSRFVFIIGMPKGVSIGEQVSPHNVVIYNGESGVASAVRVPSGQLKDAIKLGKYHDIILRWDENGRKLVPLTLNLNAQTWVKLSADEIKSRTITPPPNLEINASGINNLGDDFIYIDCKITMLTGEDPDEQQIKMYWLSKQNQNYSDSQLACVNISSSGKSQRYFIPIRSATWFTAGEIEKLKFVFPKNSTVELNELGVASPKDLMPTLNYVSAENKDETQPAKDAAFGSLSFDYPLRTDLGLVTLDRKTAELTFAYDTSMVPQAAGCSVEIARADRFFEFQNSDLPSPLTSKVLEFKKTKDQFKLSAKDFKVDGIYSIRVFATDKDGKLLANSSDEINCLIHTRPRRF